MTETKTKTAWEWTWTRIPLDTMAVDTRTLPGTPMPCPPASPGPDAPSYKDSTWEPFAVQNSIMFWRRPK